MENIIMWIVLGVGCLVILGFIVYQVIKITKMTPEERKRQIIIYLQRAVVFAEETIGKGHGEEKLIAAEAYFNKRAPWLIKILFRMTGQDSLKELIELALKEVKENLEK